MLLGGIFYPNEVKAEDTPILESIRNLTLEEKISLAERTDDVKARGAILIDCLNNEIKDGDTKNFFRIFRAGAREDEFFATSGMRYCLYEDHLSDEMIAFYFELLDLPIVSHFEKRKFSLSLIPTLISNGQEEKARELMPILLKEPEIEMVTRCFLDKQVPQGTESMLVDSLTIRYAREELTKESEEEDLPEMIRIYWSDSQSIASRAFEVR